MIEQRILDIADHLLLIERELVVQGWWDDEPPSDEALASTVPFAVDTLSFEQWLRARSAVAQRLQHPCHGRDCVYRPAGAKSRAAPPVGSI